MKGIVVFDSYYGNTELVAKHIAEQLVSEGHSVQVVRAKDASKELANGDFMFIGSPTRMGVMTRRTKKFLKDLDWAAWGTRPVAAFDTEMTDVIVRNGASAAAKIHDIARVKGARVHTPVLKVGVTGMRGPLSSDAGKTIEAYVKEFLKELTL